MSKPERDPIVVNVDKEFIPLIELVAKQLDKDKDDIFNYLLGSGLTNLIASIKFFNKTKGIQG